MMKNWHHAHRLLVLINYTHKQAIYKRGVQWSLCVPMLPTHTHSSLQFDIISFIRVLHSSLLLNRVGLPIGASCRIFTFFRFAHTQQMHLSTITLTISSIIDIDNFSRVMLHYVCFTIRWFFQLKSVDSLFSKPN